MRGKEKSEHGADLLIVEMRREKNGRKGGNFFEHHGKPLSKIGEKSNLLLFRNKIEEEGEGVGGFASPLMWTEKGRKRRGGGGKGLKAHLHPSGLRREN